MTLRALQPEALAALDDVIARAREVVDPDLLALALARIEHTVADGPESVEPSTAREAAACAVIEQELVDVANLDDATVTDASGHFDDGALADLVMASYASEAQTRLRVMADRLLGGYG